MTFDQLVDKPWSVLPLEGKYYGTEVCLPNGRRINIWIGDDYKRASSREIARGWEREDGFDHVEQKEDLQVAQAISALPVLLRFAKAMLPGFESHKQCTNWECLICQVRPALKFIQD